MPRTLVAVVVSCLAGAALADQAAFKERPTVTRAGDKFEVAFTLAGATDVEVAILDGSGKVVRHLAAGVLGGEKAPPTPLAPGLAQKLAWDGKDDFGKPLADPAGCKVRVRAGLGVMFRRFIGEDPYSFGAIDSLVSDEAGGLYVMGCNEADSQAAMVLRAFDRDGGYLRTLIPFPADLPPDAVADFARFDEQAGTFRPINRNNMYPSFYPGLGGRGGAGNRRPYPHLLIAASSKSGVLMTDGSYLCRLDSRGGAIDGKFRDRKLWPEGGRPSFGPMYLAVSPDGKWLYLSGLFSFKSPYGHKYDPAYPPGAVYRMPMDGDGTLERFVQIDVPHEDGIGGKYADELEGREKPNVAPYRGCAPIGGVVVGGDGKVYVADREHQRIAVFSPDGKPAGQVAVAWPEQVQINPKTGAVYVLQQYRGKNKILKLVKFDNIAADAKPVAEIDLAAVRPAVGARLFSRPIRMLCAAGDQPRIYVTGLIGDITCEPIVLDDAGEKFTSAQTKYRPRENGQYGWHRVAADYERDELYASDGCSTMWRYDGQTGQGGPLRRDGKPFYCTDLAVGYDGLLYVRSGMNYSGPLERYTRELAPAPFADGGSHTLSSYIYSRMGPGYAERGIGTAPDGKVFISFMYDWVKYCVAGFGPDGKALAGNYLKGLVGNRDNPKGKYPPELNSAIIGPITGSSGGVRVDLAGNIYLGLWVWPKDLPVAEQFKADPGYLAMTGSVVKFPPEGGMMASARPDWSSDPIGNTPRTPGAGGIEVRSGALGTQTRTYYDAFVERATAIYPGMAPFSHASFADNTCCVCQTVRFDLDRYGRIYMPNAVSNSVSVIDNAGNLICQFGRYGNFDSGYSPADNGKPIVATPAIPLGWPSGVAVSEKSIYVCDVYNRRAVAVDCTFACEETIDAR